MLIVIGTTGAVAEAEAEAETEAVGSDGFVPHAARSATRSPTLTAARVRLMGHRPFMGLRRISSDRHLFEG
jgi:hypothetical protein